MSAGQEVGPLDREGRSLIQPPLPPDEATRALAAAAGVSTVGLRPSFVTPAAAHSHPDCRAILILIVAPHWVYPYFQENADPSQRDKEATNRGLIKCMEEGIPVGVLMQAKPKPGVEYNVLGLATVAEWRDGYLILEGSAYSTAS